MNAQKIIDKIQMSYIHAKHSSYDDRKRIKKRIKLGLSILVDLIALLFFHQTNSDLININVTGYEKLEHENEQRSVLKDKEDMLENNNSDSSDSNDSSDSDNVFNDNNDNNKDIIKTNIIVCDISGAVKNPGVYELEEGSRLSNLVELAGGLNDDADIDRINRARVIYDGEKIYIGKIGESDVNTAIAYDGSSHKININRANSEELQTINGIGPSTAEKIIQYREEYGNFDNIEELMNVSGIGEKTFKKMKDYVTV